MTNLNVDTVKLKESGHDIIALTNELREELEAFFTRLSNMNTRTFEWVGGSSNEFIRRCNIEKTQYIKIANTLSNYGKILIEAADDYDSVAKK